jgi:hypothetical protein
MLLYFRLTLRHEKHHDEFQATFRSLYRLVLFRTTPILRLEENNLHVYQRNKNSATAQTYVGWFNWSDYALTLEYLQRSAL